MTNSHTPDTKRDFFVSCAKGLEPLLQDELQACGITSMRQTVAGLYFSGSLESAYRLCVFSRLANRVICLIASGPARDADEVYQLVRTLDWRQHMRHDQTLAVRSSGTTAQLNHTRFTAQKVKDAVVDQFLEAGEPRPSVSRDEPDLLIHAVLRTGDLILGIDLVGNSLHRRHYRQEQGVAPLKETLAAAVLIRAGWPEQMKDPAPLLYDPLCGSGTLLIEAMLMGLDIAPGLLREKKLSGWLQHQDERMQAILTEAEQRREAGRSWPGRALGCDIERDSLQKARRNAERAGLYDQIDFEYTPLDKARAPEGTSLLICNPPYAERLGDEPEALALYQELGQLLRQQPPGTRAAVLTARPEWGRLLGVHSHRQYALFNGAIPVTLLCFQISDETIYRQQRSSDTLPQPGRIDPASLDSGARMLANRLRKNLKNVGRWARQQGHECYRLYDADMPEYAFAIDLYGSQVHMQEYRAPSTVSEENASLRRRQAIEAVMAVLELPADAISLKMRQRQRGKDQYESLSRDGENLVVHEGPARLKVNLWRYLDTGLFLDHRPTRRYIGEHARGKRFLNLFCYTGAATVQAALGGARESLSIDLSNTYLDWARENLALNDIDGKQHRLLRADCLAYLEKAASSGRESFDLIFLDPPTFSNSKSTEQTLDIQRDHAELIEQCMKLLTPEGLLIFSTNRRRFQLDESVRNLYHTEDFSRASIDRDFARNPDIHQAWLIRHRSKD